MRSRISLLIPVALLACRPEARPADSEQRVISSSNASDSGIPGAGICDTVASRWRATGKAQVRVADTTMRVASDSAPQAGCVVVAFAPKALDKAQGLDSAQWRALYWGTNDTPGWATLTQYDADGPMGNERTLERQDTRCQVESQFDPEDDSDSTYVPSPWFKQSTFCWRRTS